MKNKFIAFVTKDQPAGPLYTFTGQQAEDGKIILDVHSYDRQGNLEVMGNIHHQSGNDEIDVYFPFAPENWNIIEGWESPSMDATPSVPRKINYLVYGDGLFAPEFYGGPENIDICKVATNFETIDRITTFDRLHDIQLSDWEKPSTFRVEWNGIAYAEGPLDFCECRLLDAYNELEVDNSDVYYETKYSVFEYHNRTRVQIIPVI